MSKNIRIMQLFYLMVLFFLLSVSCEKDKGILSGNSEEPEKFSKLLRGHVVLENQSDHSNALLYIDSLDIGTSSDSTGFFHFEFKEPDSLYSGIFTVYYYLADYEMDSSRFVLEKGLVVNDSLDVGCEGLLQTRQLSQVMLVNGATDKYEYAVGDTLIFTARIKNISDSSIYIRIFAGASLLRNVALYNDKYPSFLLTPEDISPAEGILLLHENQIYEESGQFIIPEGRYLSDSLYHIPGDEYIVAAGAFELVRAANPITKTPLLKKIQKFIRFKWYHIKLPVRHSPELDGIPNKFEFPHVYIKN